MQEEMDRVVGDKLITMADRSELPFTCAVVNEGLRLDYTDDKLKTYI
jgi:hypothetical protein